MSSFQPDIWDVDKKIITTYPLHAEIYIKVHTLISSVLFFAAEMNRHHYSLYVHNCRLILLLRQDPSEAENYKPAEFHWKLDQVSSF